MLNKASVKPRIPLNSYMMPSLSRVSNLSLSFPLNVSSLASFLFLLESRYKLSSPHIWIPTAMFRQFFLSIPVSSSNLPYETFPFVPLHNKITFIMSSLPTSSNPDASFPRSSVVWCQPHNSFSLFH